MGAGQRVDAIQLHKAQIGDYAVQVRAFARTAGRGDQPVIMQKQAACGAIGQSRGHSISSCDASRCIRRTCRRVSTITAVNRPKFNSPFAAAIPPNNRH